MSDSNKLRETHTLYGGGNFINTSRAKGAERKVREVIEKDIIPLVTKLYPDYKFVLEGTLYKKDIIKKIKTFLEEKGVDNFGFLSSDNPFIRPDGGLLYVEKGDKRHLVLVVEVKVQGTNDKRVSEGLNKQAQGNAVERAMKNDAELKLYMKNEKYFPYVLFCQGCDFAPGSSITDRLTASTLYCSPNHIYVKNVGGLQRTSLFVKENYWTDTEVINICLDTIKISIEVLADS